MKAADITDTRLFESVAAVQAALDTDPYWGTLPRDRRWAFTWDIQRELGAYHPKVVMAKLRSAVKRGVLAGCACGCRGDFHLPGHSPTEPRPWTTPASTEAAKQEPAPVENGVSVEK